ncbi:gliding motility-associated C-terminal domain-containing protein, partial [Bizionia sediminis]
GGTIIGVSSDVVDNTDACNILITRTWTFTDACDNTSSVSQTITVSDTTAPVAPNAPADVTYECISEVPAAQELVAIDNCGAEIFGVATDSTMDEDACNIIITRTWTFTDACNNTSSVSQTITVSDTTAPVAPAAPADVTYECISEVPAAQELVAIDNCGAEILGVATDATMDEDACNITITRTWTFTDSCDNTSSVSQTITVSDTTAPVAPAAPADVTYECISEVPVAQELTATDNCGGTIMGVSSDVIIDSDVCNITITRTWTFTDACDNTSSVSQTITVSDTTAPVAPAAPAD